MMLGPWNKQIIFSIGDVWDSVLDVCDRSAISQGSFQHFGLEQLGDQSGIIFLIWKPGFIVSTSESFTDPIRSLCAQVSLVTLLRYKDGWQGKQTIFYINLNGGKNCRNRIYAVLVASNLNMKPSNVN